MEYILLLPGGRQAVEHRNRALALWHYAYLLYYRDARARLPSATLPTPLIRSLLKR